MAVRPATEADVGAIRRVAERSWTGDYPEVVSRETAAEGVHEWYTEERVADEISRPDAAVLVAERDSEVAGFAHGVYSAEEGHLMRVYVDPDHRGEGLGSALVEAAVERLRKMGADRVRAMVLAENEPGNAFYRALGFERSGETYETEIGGEFYEENVWLLDDVA